ncbi:MAG: FAD-dependent oxidoreductase [Anaerovoracaceae bacterium]
MKKDAELIIIGAGPAGMTAAIYASRAGLNTILLESGAPGGKLLKTNEIANWPGTKRDSGSDLAIRMFEHSTIFGAHYQYGEVVSIRRDDQTFSVTLTDGSELTADAVIAAAGTKERLLNIPGEEKNIGRGVSYCAVCDGAFIRGDTAAVIGAGNSALEEADYLTQSADKVYLIMRRDVFRGDQISVEKVQKNPKIEIIQNAVPTEIKDDGKRVTGLIIRHTQTGRLQFLDVKGVFPYIGADPISGFLKDFDVLNDSGYLITDDRMRTSVPGLYGAGDVRDKALRQVVTAANDGAVAAQQAFSDLRLQP